MPKTVYGVIGHPIGHSLSPVIFSAAYKEAGIDAECVRFDVEPEKLAQFLGRVRAESIAGLSVTIPHKEAILPLLDWVDETARLIGAVNTVVNDNGKLCGFNTDWIGAQRALKTEAGGANFLAGKKVLVLGAGGAAAAVVYACLNDGAEATILNKSLEKAAELANRFKKNRSEICKIDFLDSIINHPADILINATPVGMFPNVNETLVPEKYFKKNMVVFDVVYTPMETLLVKQARAAGCKIVPGYKMLLYQAERQFELWFKKRAPIKVMESALLRKLSSVG